LNQVFFFFQKVKPNSGVGEKRI